MRVYIEIGDIYTELFHMKLSNA